MIQPIYKQIDILLDKADSLGADVRVKIQAVDDKIYEIQNEDSKIMDKAHKYEASKLINGFDINEESLDDNNEESIYDSMVNYIKSLPVLTASEKDKLLATQKKLEPYYKELEELYKELDKVQKPVMVQNTYHLEFLFHNFQLEQNHISYNSLDHHKLIFHDIQAFLQLPYYVQ